MITSALEQTNKLAKTNRITVDLDTEEAIIQGDKESLVGLFVILIENAIKYSKQNTKLHITAKKKSGTVEIAIKDYGIGITSEDIPHIFERFYRSDKSRSQTEGFGLGLSIAKQVVDKHGGHIEVTSILGKGSTFTVSLPMAQS
ncbi:ATP-binding protein [Candidatus Woesebacteria bacterium]|nr:ATP-binding protein [Candidatus Woesebacteria bacterium]